MLAAATAAQVSALPPPEEEASFPQKQPAESAKESQVCPLSLSAWACLGACQPAHHPPTQHVPALRK